MNRLKLRRLACVLATVLTTLLLTAQVARATPLTCGGWSAVPNPNLLAPTLYGVAAVSTNNVWAVGFNSISGVSQTLVEHWNGSNWSVVASPNAGSKGNFLYGVSAVSATDIWAVGHDVSSSNIPQALIEHWNGVSWSVVGSGFNLESNNLLYGVAAVSANNVWAVGYHFINSSLLEQTLIVHWNGVSWSVIASPNIGTNSNFFYSVAAASPTNLWAVGDYLTTSGVDQTLVERWNGSSWNVVPSPNVGLKGNGLNSVAAVSATSSWAVGQYGSSSGTQTLIVHWNGSSWSVIPSPNGGSGTNILEGVAAVSGSSNAWVVGQYVSSSSHQALTEFYC